MLPLFYRVAARPLAPLAVVYLKWRRKRGKEDPRRYLERQGVTGTARPQAPLLWIHAASVGEATAMLALIERLLQAGPMLEILVTTGTVTSAHLLESRLPARARHQFVPVDLPGWIARFLDHWRPDMALWVESELWPNLILATHARGIPMALVNARLSASSYARWQKWRGLIRPVLRAFSLCLAQDEEQARRFRQLGRHARAVARIRPVQHRAAEPGRLERIVTALGDERSTDKSNPSEPVKQPELAHRIGKIDIRLPGDRLTSAASRDP